MTSFFGSLPQTCKKMIRIATTSTSFLFAGLISSMCIKWDWSFFLIPTLISLAASLSNFDLISFHKKAIAMLLHCFLNLVVFLIAMGITSFTLAPLGQNALYLGSTLGAILFTFNTNIILTFPNFWLSMALIIGLSLLVWPIADYVHARSLFKFETLNGRENMILIWATLVGFGIAVGIHGPNGKSADAPLLQ